MLLAYGFQTTRYCPPANLEIQPEGIPANIPAVVPKQVWHLNQPRCGSVVNAGLNQAGNARTYGVTVPITGRCPVLRVVLKGMGAGANKAHIADQHIEKIR